MADRLSMLAEEFRVYKIETDDRLARLEAASPPASAQTDAPATSAPAKKTDSSI